MAGCVFVTDMLATLIVVSFSLTPCQLAGGRGGRLDLGLVAGFRAFLRAPLEVVIPFLMVGPVLYVTTFLRAVADGGLAVAQAVYVALLVLNVPTIVWLQAALATAFGKRTDFAVGHTDLRRYLSLARSRAGIPSPLSPPRFRVEGTGSLVSKTHQGVL